MSAAAVIPSEVKASEELFHRQLLNVVVVCRILKVSRRTVERWMAKGRVKWVRVPSGRRLIYADSLLRER